MFLLIFQKIETEKTQKPETTASKNFESNLEICLNRLSVLDTKQLLTKKYLQEKKVNEKFNEKKGNYASSVSSSMSRISSTESDTSFDFVRGTRLTQSERYSKFREKVQIRKIQRRKSLADDENSKINFTDSINYKEAVASFGQENFPKLLLHKSEIDRISKSSLEYKNQMNEIQQEIREATSYDDGLEGRENIVLFIDEHESFPKLLPDKSEINENLLNGNQQELNSKLKNNYQRDVPLFTPKDFDLSFHKNNQCLTNIRGTMLINKKKVISLRIALEKNNEF